MWIYTKSFGHKIKKKYMDRLLNHIKSDQSMTELDSMNNNGSLMEKAIQQTFKDMSSDEKIGKL